ncbi:MAG: hypothetical protein JWO58_267 [Chitinophagaceae bacterium]|nr:hypothetical protein [Chitinophagaceae bacterium]
MSRLSRLMIILLLSFICSQYTHAQTPAKWYFGEDIGLDFSTAPPTLIGTSYDNSGLAGYNVESSSVAYDTSGNMVFVAIPSSTGVYGVFDKNFVSKGTVATTSDAAQGSLVFPVPGSATTYFLCTVDAMTGTCGTGDTGSDRGANYYLVTNTGSTVTVGPVNNLVASGVAECQVGIVTSTAGSYWWVIHARGSNEFKVFKVTSSGITYDHSNFVGISFAACDYVSQLAVNDCNTKIAMTINGTVNLFDFNDTTGVVSNSRQWAAGCAYGLEFSTDNRYLFVSTGTQGGCTSQVNQYDITSGVAATINSSLSNLGATYGATGKSGHLQLGPDGNIYVAQYSANGGSSYPHYIGQISNINTKPATFDNKSIAVNDAAFKKAVTMGLPTILKASITGQAVLQIPNANNICQNANSTFSYNFTGVAVSQSWVLTPSTGFTYVGPSTSTSASPTINFTTATTYSIKVTVTDNCGYTYSDVTSITVNPQINTAATYTCGPLKGSVTSPGAYTYVWYADAALTQPVATGSTNVALPNGGSGTYYVAAETSATSANTTNTLLTTSTYDNSYAHTAATNSTSLTVTAKTTINSFQWAPGGPVNNSTPGTTMPYTLSITDASGTNTFWTANVNAPIYSTLPLQTASPAVVLPPGTYKIKIVGTANPNSMSCGCTPLVAGDNAVTVTAGSNVIKNLDYTATKYTVTAAPCSNAGSITYSCPLPVSLVDFTAHRTGEVASVLVEWSTASEQNSKVFYVQRSIDGVVFETIGQVDAAGNSTSYKPYSYNDVTAPVGNIYYRLFEVDFDGSPTYSKIVYVNGINSLNLSLVPNPGNGSFTITGLTGDTKLNVSIYAITGQSLFTTTTHPGELIDLGDLAKGFYIVKIGAGNTEQSIRYINQ